MAEEWDVFSLAPGGDYAQPEYLATLYEAREKTIRVELDGPGSGQFSINRTSPQCTEAILAQGNLVKVRIPEIHDDYIFAFFIETGDFTLISSQEAGGEMLTFGGRGILSYLEYARAWSTSYVTGGQSPIAGVWRAYAAGTGSAPGQILRRMIEEMQHADRPQQPLPLLTIDFDYTNDSTLDPWDTTDATDEFAYQVGEDGLAIATRLWETDTITMQMSPGFLLSAYNPANFGRDLTGAAFGAGVVRFERVNIATELRREQAALEVQTHMLAAGEADKYGTAALSDAASRVTKEGFIASFGTGTTALNAVAAAELQTRLRKSDTIMFPIANRRTDLSLADPVTVGSVKATPGVATAGYYLPGPEGTLGDFWVGDVVRVHTGSGSYDYNEVNAKVEAITISREDDNAELSVIPELRTTSVIPCIDFEIPSTPAGYYGDQHSMTTPAHGVTYYVTGGTSIPNVPTPGFFGNWGFADFNVGDAGAIDGSYDTAWAGAGNTAVGMFIGVGTVTCHTRLGYQFSSDSSESWFDAKLSSGGGAGTLMELREFQPCGVDIEFEIPDDGLCIHTIQLSFGRSGMTGAGYYNWGFDGFTWAPV